MEKAEDTKQNVVKKDDVKWNVKDTVFRMLFSEPKHMAEMFMELCPECGEVKPEDVERVNIESTFTRGFVNDLAIRYGNKIILMVEEQSVWDDVLPYRLDLYADQMKLKFFLKSDVSLHKKHPDESLIPDIRLAIIYLGKGHEEKEFRVSDLYPKTGSDRIIRVYKRGTKKDGIINQYFSFSHTLYEKESEHPDNHDEAFDETIKVCMKNNWLKEFIMEHETEIREISMQIHDEERIHREIMEEEKEEARKEGRAEGRAEGRVEGKTEARAEIIRSIYNNLLKTLPEEKAKEQTIFLLSSSEEEFQAAIR